MLESLVLLLNEKDVNREKMALQERVISDLFAEQLGMLSGGFGVLMNAVEQQRKWEDSNLVCHIHMS